MMVPCLQCAIELNHGVYDWSLQSRQKAGLVSFKHDIFRPLEKCTGHTPILRIKQPGSKSLCLSRRQSSILSLAFLSSWNYYRNECRLTTTRIARLHPYNHRVSYRVEEKPALLFCGMHENAKTQWLQIGVFLAELRHCKGMSGQQHLKIAVISIFWEINTGR